MKYRYLVGNVEKTVEIEGFGGELVARVDDRSFKVRVTPVAEGSMLLHADGRAYVVRYARDARGIHLSVGGTTVLCRQPGQASTGSASGAEAEVVGGRQVLVAPMPGQVVKVNVSVGDLVSRKQCLVIVEAMKMENELVVAIDGTVTAVHVQPGQQVDALQPLVEVTALDG